MCIDVIFLFEDSSKNPNIDPRARFFFKKKKGGLIGKLGIKAMDNLTAFCLGHMRLEF